MGRDRKVETGSIYDRGERVLVKDQETWVVRAGVQGGTPVVFLHGIPTSAYVYRDVLRAMYEEHDCIAFDWPGFGLSERPGHGDYTHRARADHLAALVEVLELDRVNLVVHDIGGPAGLLYATENPDRIERLVILNTTVFKRDYHPPLPALAQFVPVVRDLARPLFTRPLFEFYFKRGLARPARLGADVLENHWRLAHAQGRVPASLETWAQLPDGAEAITKIRAGLASFPFPTLVLFGADDPFLPPPNAERFAKAIPGAELQLLAGAGHFLQEDAPAEVAERLLAFLASAKR